MHKVQSTVLALALTCVAGSWAAAATPTTTRTSWDVRAYGATGDGKTLDTPAINRAIDDAAAAGGGCVHFGAGTYVSVSIHLKSNIALDLDAGATIVAGQPENGLECDDPEPNPAEGKQSFGHTHWHDSLIWGENLQNVAITGRGMIWGKGLVRGHNRPEDRGDKAIALKLCKHVLIRDVTIYHGGHVALLASGVDDLTIDHVTVDTNRDGIDLDCCRDARIIGCRVNAPLDDGICMKSSYALGELRDSQNIVISNCQLSGYDEGSILNCNYQRGVAEKYQKGPNGRIKFGTESNGGLKNVVISNCTFEYCAGLAIESVDGGDVEDVTISNLTMRDVINAPIFLRLGARLRGPTKRSQSDSASEAGLNPREAAEVAYAKAMASASADAAATTQPLVATSNSVDPVSNYVTTGTFRRITISNVNVFNASARDGVTICGIPGHPIEDIKLADIRLSYTGGGTKKPTTSPTPEAEAVYPEPGMFGPLPDYGFFVRHVRNIEFDHVTIGFEANDDRAAFSLEDVVGADFDHVSAQHASGSSELILRNVQDLHIHESAGLPNLHESRVEQKDL